MRFFALLCLLGAALASDLENFSIYQNHFGKEYHSKAEAVKRAEIFRANVAKIHEHNVRFENGEETYKKGINQFTDMTEKEFLEYINGVPKSEVVGDKPASQKFLKFLNTKTAVAEEFNWVEQGGVTSVKNQGGCGSCTAFAVTATLDTCFYQSTGTLFDDLSEQFLVDCANNHYWNEWGAFGCSGAWPQAYFDYLINRSGGQTQTEAAYPYDGYDGACRQTGSGWYSNAAVINWENVFAPEEASIMKWVSEVGPVVTTIYASGDFSGYAGGVLNARDCCNNIEDPECSYSNNHAVAIVGYGHDNASGLDFWLVKNSWGDWWGDNGYIKVMRGYGHCGIFGHSASGPTACY